MQALKRKASHRGKEKVKLRFHIVVLSAVGMARSLERAVFVVGRGDHEFESNSTSQEAGSFLWNERVSQVVTLFRDADGGFETKEYKLVLYEVAPGKKAGTEKRGAAIAGGRLDLSRYAHAKVGKRVVLTLDPPAGSGGRPVTAVVTVAAEPAGKADGGEDSQHNDAAEASRLEDDQEEEEAHPNVEKPIFNDSGSDEEPPEPQVVRSAAGAHKPLPPPPPPAQLQAKAVQWQGAGADAVRETRRFFAACCPCLTRADEFEPR